ncbi:MAG TPA: hypothetical protein VFT48_11720 [Pyrinomonadaceae bacterium]|nr:hypothetical protein [Pyrinomonadaceae bacterium]
MVKPIGPGDESVTKEKGWCPIFLARSLLSEEQQHDARAAIRALPLQHR